jgi:hypothetical protein
MTAVFVLLGLFLLAGVLFGEGRTEKPTELDPNIWVPDPEERAARLRAAVAAWRQGRRWTPPEKLKGQGVYLGRLPSVADPNGGAPARKLVRCCPMHKPHWE